MTLALERRFGCQRLRLGDEGWGPHEGRITRGTYGFTRQVQGNLKFADVEIVWVNDRVVYEVMLDVARKLGFTDPRELVAAALDPELDN